MTHHLDDLTNPPTAGLSVRERQSLAYELVVVGRAAHERAQVLRATGHRGVELAVVELDEFAHRVLRRARRYQPPAEGNPP